MNDFERLKRSIKISDVFCGEGYELHREWPHQYKTHCINPEHPDKNPSLQVSDEKGIYKCFICENITGDIFNLLDYIRPDIKWKKAQVIYLEKKYLWKSWNIDFSIKIPDKKVNIQGGKEFRKIMNDIAIYWSQKPPNNIMYTYILDNKTISYKQYKWEKIVMQWYGLSEEIIKEYLIGYSPNSKDLYKILSKKYDKELIDKTALFDSRWMPIFKERIIIPYMVNGDVIYFIARQTEYTPPTEYERAKYKNQSIDNKYLYNQDDLNNFCVFIVEWAFDCLALKKIWYNSIALSGIEWDKKLNMYMKKLQECNLIYICFDNDRNWAWNKKAKLVNEKLLKNNISSQIVTLPLWGKEKSIDINEYLWKHSKQEFNTLLTF